MPIQKITSGIIQDGAVAAADIVSVSNTAISGNIISSQITSVANTQITGNITSSQITSNPTLYGNVSVTGVIAVGGATPTTNGSGITFPATQSSSTNANTLDDYEEGTWTPSVTFGGGSTGQTGTFAGFYTKTGNQVFATALINLTNKGSSTGTMGIAGLPFTSNSDSNYRATSTSVLWDNLATAYVYMLTLIPGSSTTMEFLAATASSTTNAANPTQAAVNNTSVLRVSITYQV